MNVIEQLAPRLQRFEVQPQIASHDSAFVGLLPMDNQNLFVTAQLDMGVHFLQAQTHLDRAGKLSLCHTNCGMKDAGSVEDFLITITDWLEKHPREVVTLLLTNGDYVSLDYFEKSFNSSGASEHAYVPIASRKASVLDSWPTLGELIDSGKRLVAFLAAGAEESVPYILSEFGYFWETPFDTTDPNFPQCTISRPGDLHEYPAVAKQKMIIMNHYLDTNLLGMDVPDRRDARKTNAETGAGSIGEQAALCQGLHGRVPVGLLVDYVEQGEGLKAQDTLNGLF